MSALSFRLAEYISGLTLCMEPGRARAALLVLAPRLGMSVRTDSAPAEDGATLAAQARSAREASLTLAGAVETVEVGDGLGEYALTEDGMAIVSIAGTLVSRFGFLDAACGLTSYESLNATADALAQDPRVGGVMLDVNSGGGVANGMLDTADAFRALDGIKPVFGYANSVAGSAAYGLIASGSRVFLPRMALVGSIGAMTVHIDQSAADAARGLAYTALFAGDYKVDGWDHAPLADDARVRIMARITSVRDQFAQSVATHRGLSLEAVLDTKAGVLLDHDAVSSGLADDVLVFADAMDALRQEVRARATNRTTVPSAGGQAPANAVRPRDKEIIMGLPKTRAPGKGVRPIKTETAVEPPEDNPAEDEATPGGADGDETEGADGEGEDGDEGAAEKVTAARTEAAEIVAACVQAGAPQLAAGFISAGTPLTTVKAKLDTASSIRALVADAAKASPNIRADAAEALIGAGATLAEARKSILDAMLTGQAPAIRSAAPDPVKKVGAAIDVAAIYARANRLK
ncbi:S49 family peptidase [Nitrospirillum iridis]|uniref:ClpP class serine protease n=1 Tax=Nitrospirillum iridis TaxID=765888 RepID=A0A7X0AWI5_9PROT|nr:S49 family peptidase [Nitrospirillum iridis]MBB6251422.1 ClpP class serine protease [Nitrospirillum iridis]